MNLIVAVDELWGIGRDNKLLFHIPKDMKFFRETTIGKTVIMGRKTLESFPGGKPLLKRQNIVLTNNKDFCKPDVLTAHCIDEALAVAPNDSFIIGGATVYKAFLPYCETAYITKVEANGNADCFFPNLDNDPKWQLKEKSSTMEDNGYRFVFCTYKRINQN